MKEISINNGLTFCSAEEALEEKGFEVIHHYMDADICETVNNEIAPCTELEFLQRYLELTPEDLIVG
jgi:hypothetical protein